MLENELLNAAGIVATEQRVLILYTGGERIATFSHFIEY